MRHNVLSFMMTLLAITLALGAFGWFVGDEIQRGMAAERLPASTPLSGAPDESASPRLTPAPTSVSVPGPAAPAAGTTLGPEAAPPSAAPSGGPESVGLPRVTPKPLPASSPTEAPARVPAIATHPLAPGSLHIVQVDVVSTRQAASELAGSLRERGFAPYIVATRNGFAVRLGAFRSRDRAERLAATARAHGIPATILTGP